MRFSLFPLTTSFLVYFFCLHLSLHPPSFSTLLFPLYSALPPLPLLSSPPFSFLHPPFSSLLFSTLLLLLFTGRCPLFTPFSCSFPPLYPLFLLFAPSLPPIPAFHPLFLLFSPSLPLFLLFFPSLPTFPALRPLFTPFSCSFPHLYPLSCSLNPFTPFSCFLPPLYPLGCARSDCATHSGTLGGCQGGSVQELVLDQTRHFFIPLIIVIFRHTNQPVYLSICLSNLKIKRF